MSQLWSVIKFEFNIFARSKTFIVVTIILISLSLLGPLIPIAVHTLGGITAERTIAVVDNTGWFSPDILDEFLVHRAIPFSDITAATHAVEEGAHNYVLEITSQGFTLHVTAMGLGAYNIHGQAAEMLRHRHRIDQFAELGIAEEQATKILNTAPIGEILTIGVAGADVAGVFFENFIYAYAMTFVLYLGLLMGGAHLLTTVVREKSTKTMEILITSCPPSKLLNGKVLGVGGAILLQLLLMVGAAFISMRGTALITYGMEDMFVVVLRPELLVFLVVFFLLGFVLYSYIYAALASTTSRQEDATSIGQLPQLLLVAGYISSIIGMNMPGAGWVTAMSHIPFFAPFVMFVRICMGTAASWEIVISIAMLVVTIGIISWAAAKIYRMGTLMYGAKPTLKGLLAAFR